MGIIDILQKYDISKKLERFAKIYLQCKDKEGISVVNPNKYAERFLRRISGILGGDGPQLV